MFTFNFILEMQFGATRICCVIVICTLDFIFKAYFLLRSNILVSKINLEFEHTDVFYYHFYSQLFYNATANIYFIGWLLG